MKEKNQKEVMSFSILFIVTAVLIFTGCTQQTGNKNTVSIDNLSYNPSSLTITVGETVTWTNNDNVDHTVTSEGVFDSGLLSSGDTFEYTFDEPGTYDYTCTIHPSMQATIIVEEQSGPY